MPHASSTSLRRLPDGTVLCNRLLAALPRAEYDRILKCVKMTTVTTGHTLHAAPRAPMAAAEAGPRRRRHLFTRTGISCRDARCAPSDRDRCPARAPAIRLISSRCGRIHILQRKRLEAAACECYGVIRAHFARLGL
jgi:hypothetical protein